MRNTDMSEPEWIMFLEHYGLDRLPGARALFDKMATVDTRIRHSVSLLLFPSLSIYLCICLSVVFILL